MADVEEDSFATMTPAQRKLFDLRMKVNAGRKANKQEVANEHERLNNGDKKAKKEQAVKRKEVGIFVLLCSRMAEKKAVVASGKAHLEDTAESAELKAKNADKKGKRKAAFGWDVFNQDSLYKAYKKRLTVLPTAEQAQTAEGAEVASHSLEDELSYGKGTKDAPENVDRMASELEERIKARKSFSRRRAHQDGEDVDYINHQNQIFNRKAKQAFDKYTVEIRQNLERGTAL